MKQIGLVNLILAVGQAGSGHFVAATVIALLALVANRAGGR